MNAANGTPGEVRNSGFKRYAVGFFLALLLTVLPFGIVMDRPGAMPAAIAAFGIAQIIVHLVFFLHVNDSSKERWNLMALLFTVVVVVIIVGGSMWIMHNLDHNMMPMMAGDT